MVVTTSWISSNYTKFNDLYFGGTLPNIKFKTNRSKNSWGFASFIYDWANDTIIPECITMSNYYDSPEEVKIQTLLHEMIHIEDYFWHPEHFIRNRRKVSKRSYDAHGYWFTKEARRISKESGYKVSSIVTDEEMKASKLSESTRKSIENKKSNALICAVIGTTGIWYFKTELKYVDYLKKNVPTMYDWNDIIGTYKRMKFYTFENDSFASRKSCCSNIRGWRTDKFGFMNKMESFKAMEVYV